MKKTAKFLLAFVLLAAVMLSPLQVFAADFTEDFLQKAQDSGSAKARNFIPKPRSWLI